MLATEIRADHFEDIELWTGSQFLSGAFLYLAMPRDRDFANESWGPDSYNTSVKDFSPSSQRWYGLISLCMHT